MSPWLWCATHIRGYLSGEGAKGTCRFLALDDITGQVKPNNTIIQEQSLPCKSFSGHLVAWAWMRGRFRRMEPIQQSFLLAYTCSQPQTSNHNSRCYLSVPLNFRNTHTLVHTHSSPLCLCGLILGCASMDDCWLQNRLLSLPFTRGCTTVRFHANKHNLFPQFARQ